jgi:hypothetical protein
MGHFSETFRIKIDPNDCNVELSVKSADGRADMHIIDVRDFNAATQEVSYGWGGCDAIKTKRIGNDVLVSIEESEHKRVIYRFSYQEWRILCEQFVGEVRSSGIEISPYIVKEAANEIQIPVEDIINALQQTLMPQIEAKLSAMDDNFATLLSRSNLIQVTAVQDTSTSTGGAVFIPSDIINTDLSGNAQVNTQQSSSSAIDDALAALKKLKGE